MTIYSNQLNVRPGRSKNKRLAKRRKFLGRLGGFEALETRVLMARDFMELPANDSFPGQVVQHFNPSELGVVDSYSNGANVTDGDLDFYTFTAAVTGEVQVSLRHMGGNPSTDDTLAAGDDLVLQQVNGIGTLIGVPQSVLFAGSTASKTVAVAAGAQLWFRVSGQDAGDDANYQVEFKNVDREDDLGSNNNVLSSATPLGTFGAIAPANLQGYTITSPDKDFFSFVVPANTPGQLAISAAMPAGSGAASGLNGPTNLGVRIRNSAGTVIASSNGTTTALDTAVIDVPNSASALTYTIEVYSGSLGQVNRYDLAIVANPGVTGALSGFKFDDLNADGLWDENEPGMPGVTINLDLGNDGGAPDQTAMTNGAGAYSFLNVPLGTHRLYETTPANSTQSLPGAAGNFEYIIDVNPNDVTLDHLDFGSYQLDFGDSPDPTFPTLLVNDGARHLLSTGGLRLGATVDAELNGQPNAGATGDGADEDGFVPTNVWTQGQTGNYVVTSSGDGYLSAWVDFNNDGDWIDLGETIANATLVTTGANPLTVAVPVGAVVGSNLNARFRLSSAPVASPTGLAIDGEVEDYQLQVYAPATIDFVTTTSSVAEGAVQTVTLRLNLATGTLANAVTANVNDQLTGSATSGVDYTALAVPVPVLFAAGSVGGATVSFNVTTTDDSLAENDETINALIASLTNAGGQVTIGANAAHTVTITDATDRGAVSLRFAAANSSVAEAAVGHNVNVELVTTGGVTLAVAVTANVTDATGGTATSAADYNAIGTQPVTFPIGAGNGVTQPATVVVLNDTVAEADETVNLSLGAIGPFGTLAAPSTHVVTITDATDRGNVTVQFQTATSNVAEATTNHNVAVLLAMAGGVTSIGAGLTVSVGDAGGGSATSGSDYSAVGVQTITFPSGSLANATQNAVVGVLDDTLAEPDETVNLGLTFVSGPGAVGAPTAHAVTITDGVDRGQVSFRFLAPTSNGLEQVTPHNVVVEMVATGGVTLGGPVVVNVTDAGGGTATPIVDYGVIGTIALNFPAGSATGATQSAAITIVNDGTFESPDETINLAMAVGSGPASGVSSQPTHVVTIVDSADQPTVTVAATTQASEPSTNGLFTFTLSSASATDTNVNYSIAGTATAGVDYTALSGTATILAGNLTGTVLVPVLDDLIVEPSETVMLTITGVVQPGILVGGANMATVNIADNDATTVSIVATDANASETPVDQGQFTISLGGGKLAPTGGITVNFTVGGTATAPADYMAIGASALIPAGANSVAVPVQGIVDDALVEGNETVVVTLTSTDNVNAPLNASPAAITATVTIADNDFAAITGKKFNDVNGNGNDNGGADPGLAGWTIELFSDLNNNNVFEPTIQFGDFVIPGADGAPTTTAVTDANGNYNLGPASMPTGRYFVREVQQQGWKQTAPAAVHTINYMTNVPVVAPQNFGNMSCTDTQNVVNGTTSYTAVRAGVLTVELVGAGTFQVSKTGPTTTFQAYNGDYDSGTGAPISVDSSVLPLAAFDSTSLSSPSGMHKRVDIKVAAGDMFNIVVSGATAGSTLRILNAVNIATASTLALQITGGDCGETIAVQDDTQAAATSDAKRIFIGALPVTAATLNNGVDVDPANAQGVQYDAKILDALFGSPSISRVEVTANGGDDVVRIGSTDPAKDITQQSTISGGAGNDIVRGGSGKATINGGAGGDVLLGGIADDVIYGGDGNDLIYGSSGNDTVGGDNNNDWVGGGAGDDPIVRGGAGNDRLSGGTGRDGIYGDAGTDLAYREATDIIVLTVETPVVVTPGDNTPLDADLLRVNNNLWDETLGAYLADGARDTMDEILNALLN